ncbi:quinol monooxygenase YgiN [Friedmanniella endophytica]|uniref:Quinol monooxygenase YgiN n=1 Tax=Microlunatus kandeliicorticis TaxID=1759536 RepID=A0A7W3ISV9_9ACTN|nr:antibiotic biosynthesis monooxygenase [Microlunatus kandeliicorticis]MBA8794614.1 quinol monooxygenase YgiN [Microlunatus kandeliicorticis]
MTVHLTGRLICADEHQTALVRRLLAEHVALTRAEPGCLAFAVDPTDNPRVWRVEETFADAAAFRAHQQRIAGSVWGRETAGIARDYEVSGLDG